MTLTPFCDICGKKICVSDSNTRCGRTYEEYRGVGMNSIIVENGHMYSGVPTPRKVINLTFSTYLDDARCDMCSDCIIGILNNEMS